MKKIILLFVTTASFLVMRGQIIPLISCHIDGPTTVNYNDVWTYTLESPCNASSWTCSCGTILSSTSSTVDIQFNGSGCSSALIRALGSTSSLTVTIIPPVVAGSISPSSQTINYNTTPSSMSISGTSGGNGTYTYQWQSSSNSGFTSPTNVGTNSTSYSPPALTSSTYYRVGVTSNGSSPVYSSSVLITVYPQVVSGSVSPSTQTINYNTTPSSLSVSGTSGGNGTYSYQWQSSSNSGFTSPTNVGTNSTSYSPPALTSTTYYRVGVTSNGSSTVYSSSVVVNVYPQVVPGTISPSSQTINYNTTPSSLSISSSSGGNGTYSYQWQSSANSGFTSPNNVGTNSTSYSPPALTSTTYYRVGVTSNGSSAVYSSSVVVNVYPQLISGTISPSSQTINYNTAASGMSISGTSGGSGTYTYAWYFSPTSGGAYTQVGTASSYSPGVLAATTWYEVVTTSNGANVTSTPVEVTVNPQVLPGNISPASATITSGTSPGTLTATPASGGSCGSFAYQWQSSPDNSTWSTIGGATSLSYSPGSLSVLIYYRVRVICGTDTEYTASVIVSIGTINSDLNYIRTRVLAKPGVTDTVTADGLTSPFDVSQTTQYYDGLGRPVQTVAMQETPLQKDLVVSEVYDNFGRRSTSYLPYAASTSDGNFKSTALADQSSFNSTQFPNEQYYYSGTTFEASMLNRPLEGDAPGISWIGSRRGVGAQYLINTAADSVQKWTIGSQQLSLPVDSGAYPVGQLYKNLKTDESGNQTVEYKDKLGKTILKKMQGSPSPSSGHAGWLCTYYIYDTLQNLRFVLQPQAVALVNGSWSVSQTLADGLCYRYEYDGRKRMILKKTPGTGAVIMVYDVRNRLVMQQDSSLRGAHKWLFTNYDVENRPDSSGTITDPTNYGNPAYHDSLAYYSINYPSVGSYTNELLTQNFYDDYSWVSTYGAPVSSAMATNYTSNSSYFITSYNVSPTYAVAITPFVITRGMLTGSMKKVIGSASQYLYSASFYDDRGRAIQAQSVNYTGGIDTITMQYSFSGAMLRTLDNHKKNGNTTQNHIVLTKMDYDHSRRLKHIWKNIDGAASDQLIDSMQYNELGQLRAKYLGNNVDSLIYDYNIRGWLTGINKKYVAGSTNQYFGMELGYDKDSSVAPGNTYIMPEYNGNIEGTVWKSAGSGMNRKYDYSYDNANRLTSAAFLQNTSGTSWDNSQIDFSVGNLSYDANGNILTMDQKGYLVGGSSFIDQLKYTYQTNSNKLSQVYDTANNPTSLLGDFHWSGTKQDTDYYYDGNGNLTQDNNRVLSSITYNYLNLPQLVVMAGKGTIAYTYDAAGTKLSKVISDTVAKRSTTILYIGGFVYQQTDTITNAGGGTDTLQFIAHEDGRARWAFHKYFAGGTGYKLEYDFFEKDNQGNTRVVLTQERDTANYMATMEAANRSTESQLFANIAATSYAWSSVPGSSGIPSGTKLLYTNPNDSVSLVDSTGASGHKTGPSLLLKVMSGDTVSIGVQAYYNTNSATTANSSFSDVLNSLASGLVNTATGQTEGTLGGFTSSSGPVYSALSSFLTTNDPAPPSGYPKAYLNWIFLDDQFNYVSSSSGAVAVASTTYPAGQLNSIAPGAPLNITKNGYLYIWVSNETQGWDVFFDNLSAQHRQGPLLEENHYYPFGLTMAALSDKAIKTQYVENKYRYDGGAELQNKEFSDGSGLELYETGFRSYDPQVGRFFQIDPMTDRSQTSSPYEYAVDNPVLYNDPTGAVERPNHPVYGDGNDDGPTLGSGLDYIDGVLADLNASAQADLKAAAGSGSTAGSGTSGNTVDFLNNIIGELESNGGGTWTSDGSENGAGTFDFSDPAGMGAGDESLDTDGNPWDIYRANYFTEKGKLFSGASISFSTDVSGMNYSGYNYIQTLNANPDFSVNGNIIPNPVVDGTFNKDGTRQNYPYYYTADEIASYVGANIATFEDNPATTRSNYSVNFSTTLVGFSNSQGYSTVTPIATVNWGYQVSGYNVTLLPVTRSSPSPQTMNIINTINALSLYSYSLYFY